MKTWVKVLLISFLIFSSIFAIGSLFLFHNESKKDVLSEIIKDENKLMIGTYIESSTSLNEKSINCLHISIYENGKKQNETIDLVMNDEKLIIDERYSNVAFFDLTEMMQEYTDGKGINSWSKLNEGNYISVQTEFNTSDLKAVSEEVKITDSGRYFINVPTEDHGKVQVEHSFFYIQKLTMWE